MEPSDIPQPKDQAEYNAAIKAYNFAVTEADKVKVLQQYPFLAGLDYQRYLPAAAPAPQSPEK